MRPDACTLPTAEVPMRLAEFDALLATARLRDRTGSTRLRLVLDAPIETVRDLAARESECCSFFDFGVTPLGDVVEVTVTVPPAYVGVLDALAAR
ncbi:hypothetical protein [Actinoplanes friuliensis]|uniref:Arsenate reductase n=1 Tax=Actinoplanes friuliensis DSM 7358 TaxID=1246995 RepID=U5W7P4_9ACTN|nr:hypothetical protein [Actinoplanes friuliensis]AGZ45027.1 hypothetical protein AFR_33845 [Actinoplanes friuliensis DSM 7358]